MPKSEKNISIQKRQQHAFTASVENAKQANEAVKSYQNWLLILGTVELTFLGTLILKDNSLYAYYIKFLIVLILVAFLGFIFGSFLQFKHALRTARMYEKIANRALDYLREGINEVEEFPSDIKLPKEQIKTSGLANTGFTIFLFLLIFVNIGIIILIILI